ncbi:CDP-diacylglycerol--glycerol-3-phosphate 3-phosphatidyltransferase [Entomophthora muscae]|uniref:CDP-diacylglycerol--glycerol-3-phosphate 3-phosphatidyltransferase n=1 Tax=Entomophthora muscae TaxID=34485 RepID=A0ACC2SIR9_9FUNG|nr:CDP-diacylglycerol--glycerol-3-phosphate 3-phosphatidyltransferase [Entomophthora muscae]
MVDFLLDIRDPFSLDGFANLDPNCDTVVVPVVQMGQLNILQDQRVTLEILQSIHSSGRTKAGVTNRYSAAITSGYFNFNKLYQEKILQTSALFDIITASPEANGFFGSKGISKYIPDAYTIIEDAFIGKTIGANRFKTIKVEEYSRPNWTYHAKGLWLKQPNEHLPFLTSIGSPNFGYRSLERDLEAQVFLMTANPRLRHDMHKELDNIRKYVSPVTEESLLDISRAPRLFAKIATPLVRSML